MEKAAQKKKPESRRKRKIPVETDTESGEDESDGTVVEETPSSGSDVDDAIVADDIREGNKLEDKHECCYKCKKKDQWYNRRAWIGCNSCNKWFHRLSCTTDVVARMSFFDIPKFDFQCGFCNE